MDVDVASLLALVVHANDMNIPMESVEGIAYGFMEY